MKQYMQNLISSSKRLFVFFVVACLIIAFNYRNKNYNLYPPVYDTFDEFASGWNGLSLLRSGIPTSWSFIPNYAQGIPKGAKLDLIGTNIWVNGKRPDIFNYKNYPKPVLLTKEFDL